MTGRSGRTVLLSIAFKSCEEYRYLFSRNNDRQLFSYLLTESIRQTEHVSSLGLFNSARLMVFQTYCNLIKFLLKPACWDTIEWSYELHWHGKGSVYAPLTHIWQISIRNGIACNTLQFSLLKHIAVHRCPPMCFLLKPTSHSYPTRYVCGL